MKILCDNVSKVGCYTQVRDLRYLGIVHGSKGLLLRYKAMISNGKVDTDFIRVIDKDTLSLLIGDDNIINFLEYKDRSSFGISTEIISRSCIFGNYEDELVSSHITTDLRDILAFKRHDLSYSIPIVPTDRILFISGDMRFSSTNYDGVYLLKCGDEDSNVKNYLDYCMKSAIDMDYNGEELGYMVISNNSDKLVIRVNVEEKKNKSNFTKRLHRKK